MAVAGVSYLSKMEVRAQRYEFAELGDTEFFANAGGKGFNMVSV